MSIPAGESMPKFPLKPGYYWAKWRIATLETHEGRELTPCDDWEIVQVNENARDWESNPAKEKALSVSVCGVREAQWRDSFVWGNFVAPLDATNVYVMAAAPELLDAAKTCLAAERERLATLKPGAPATTYCEKRIALIAAAIAKAEGKL